LPHQHQGYSAHQLSITSSFPAAAAVEVMYLTREQVALEVLAAQKPEQWPQVR
jgi:hypothetical protein